MAQGDGGCRVRRERSRQHVLGLAVPVLRKEAARDRYNARIEKKKGDDPGEMRPEDPPQPAGREVADRATGVLDVHRDRIVDIERLKRGPDKDRDDQHDQTVEHEQPGDKHRLGGFAVLSCRESVQKNIVSTFFRTQKRGPYSPSGVGNMSSNHRTPSPL